MRGLLTSRSLPLTRRARGFRRAASTCAAACVPLAPLGLFAASPAARGAVVLTTLDAGAADAEVREEAATAMRGDLSELASRRGTSQNSVMLLRFDTSALTPATLVENPQISLALNVNTTSWTPARQNSTPNTPETGTQFGLSYYGLSTTAADQTWAEATVTYATAPGLTLDSNVATKDYNADTTHLGDLDFLPIQPSDELPVGFLWQFSSPALTTFITNAVTAGADQVTLLVGINQGAAGYNYIFASNDAATLLTHASWDPDGSGPEPAQAAPLSGADNSQGQFAPRLILDVPEPGSLAALGIAALLGLRRRSR